MAAAEKKCRWRKEKKEEAAPLPKVSLSQAAATNEAAALAFKGLHGARSEFALFQGSMDSAYRTVLGGDAHYYRGLACDPEDFSSFEALLQELSFVPCWMQGGTPLYRPTALGKEEAIKKSPTYERILRFLAGHFGVQPIRSLVNYYRHGEDWTSFHSDQYFSGVNMTVGASFGEERTLLFEHRESQERFSFPQRNGDVFAFGDKVNSSFSHSVPKEGRRARSVGRGHSPGRVSVILWCRREQPEWKRLAAEAPLNLLSLPHVLEHDPKLPPPEPLEEAVVESKEPETQVAEQAAQAAPAPAPGKWRGARARAGQGT